MIDAVLHGVERHAVRGIGIVENEHLCPRLSGKLRRSVRTVVRDDKDVEFFARVRLLFQKALYRIENDVFFIVCGNEIRHPSLDVALFPRLLFDKGKEHVKDLQKQRDRNDNQHDVVDDAQHAEQDLMPHRFPSIRPQTCGVFPNYT